MTRGPVLGAPCDGQGTARAASISTGSSSSDETTELIVAFLTGSTYLGGTSANQVFVELQSDQNPAYLPAGLALVFCCAIHLSVRASSMSSGNAPPLRISSWNVRTSKFGPSSFCARWRSPLILSCPSL